MTVTAFKQTRELLKDQLSQKSQLKALLEKNSSFYYKHVSLTSLMCCYILDSIQITDVHIKEKLCIASNVQNLFLHNKKEVLIISDDELNEFPVSEHPRIIQHPILAVDLLSKNPKMDKEILTIIKEQHGDKRGIGYSDVYESSFQLSLIFQVASLFSQLYLEDYERSFNPHINSIYDKISDKLQLKDQPIINNLRVITNEI